MSVNSIFNGRIAAGSADGIPLKTYAPAGAQQAVVSMFAAWEMAQFAICLLVYIGLGSITAP